MPTPIVCCVHPPQPADVGAGGAVYVVEWRGALLARAHATFASAYSAAMNVVASVNPAVCVYNSCRMAEIGMTSAQQHAAAGVFPYPGAVRLLVAYDPVTGATCFIHALHTA